MSPAAPLVRMEVDGPVALVTLDHPPVNVLSADLLEELARVLDRVRDDTRVRVVVLGSAAERTFAAGANIREMAPMGPAEAQVHGARGQGITRQIERLPVPVIAAVHGTCLGGGCEIAMACDFIVASDDATFGQPEINLGVMPGWGGTRRLPRRIGAARARAWIMTGRPVRAADALDQGLIHQVVPRAELRRASLDLAHELASKPATAIAAAKLAILEATDAGIDSGLAFELHLWSRLFGTPDQREGMAAFLEKRPMQPAPRPSWPEMVQRFGESSEGTDPPKPLTRGTGKP